MAAETEADKIGVNALSLAKMQDNAYKYGGRKAGEWLGIPFFLVVLLLILSGHIGEHDRRILRLMLGYMVWVVCPCAACLSTAMSAYASLERAGAVRAAQTVRAMFGRYALALIPFGAVLLGTAWRLHHSGRPAASMLGEPIGILGGIVLALLGGCLVGSRVGATAYRTPTGRLTCLITRCWRNCLASGTASKSRSRAGKG